MGGCLSIVPSSEVPRCGVCGKEGPKPWGQMDTTQRQAFVWEGIEVFCKKCVYTRKLEKLTYEKDRRAYKRAKEAMYPKPTEGVQSNLKRIKTGEQWDGTQSFYSGWMPSSALKRLLSAIRMAQADDPQQFTGVQRKGTGFVPAATAGAAAGGPLQQLSEEASEGGAPSSQGPGATGAAGAAGAAAVAPGGVGQRHADAVEVDDLTAEDVQRQKEQDYFAASHRQLAALEEEQGLEAVEEESLAGDFSRDMSGLSKLEEDGEEDGGSGAGRQQQPQPEQQQRPSSGGAQGKRDEFSAAGDSAYAQAEGAAAAGAGPAGAAGAEPAAAGQPPAPGR